MVQWHSTFHPRANWKPSGSSWSLGRAIDPCAGMGTDGEAQHRHGQLGLEVPSCSSWEGGAHHQWRSAMQRPLTPGSSRVDDDSQSRCEKEGSSKSRLESGQPFSGGVRGSDEKSVNSVVVRPRMARYWEPLTWLERGEGQTRQDLERSGLTRRQWKVRLMREKVLQMQETNDLEVGRVLKRLVESSPKALENDLEEGLLVLLSGVMEVAGSQAVGALASVLQALDAMPGNEWEDEDEESYYSDEDGEEDANPDMAGKGIGECGRVQLSESLWSRAVPDDLLHKYRHWLKETGGGVGDSKGVGVAEMLESLVEGGSLRRVSQSLGASGKARVIPNNSEKCSLIMNCMKQNASDCRPPPKFVLPQLEALRDCLLLGKRKRVYMIKFDVSNCYWSILMPKRWRDIFQACNGLKMGSFHLFGHPKLFRIIPKKNHIFDPFLPHFWSQNNPWSRYFGILGEPKQATTSSKRAKNTCFGIPCGPR